MAFPSILLCDQEINKGCPFGQLSLSYIVSVRCAFILLSHSFQVILRWAKGHIIVLLLWLPGWGADTRVGCLVPKIFFSQIFFYCELRDFNDKFCYIQLLFTYCELRDCNDKLCYIQVLCIYCEIRGCNDEFCYIQVLCTFAELIWFLVTSMTSCLWSNKLVKWLKEKVTFWQSV